MNGYVQIFSFMNLKGERFNMMGTTLIDEEDDCEYECLIFENPTIDEAFAESVSPDESFVDYRLFIREVKIETDKITFTGSIISNIDFYMTKDELFFFLDEDSDFYEVKFNMAVIDYDINSNPFNYCIKTGIIEVVSDALECHGIIPLKVYEYNRQTGKRELKKIVFNNRA